MAVVTQTIPNYLGGVSKQTDEKKLPGQVRECINAIPDPTLGLIKRPGLKFGYQLTTNSVEAAKWFYINRDGDEKYIGRITDGSQGDAIAIWNVNTGVACTVHMDAIPWAVNTAYAVGDIRKANSKVYKCTTAGTSDTSGTGPSTATQTITDGTVIWDYVRDAAASSYLNTNGDNYQLLTVQDTSFLTNKTKVITEQAAPTYDPSLLGTIQVKTVAYGTKYEVIIDGIATKSTADPLVSFISRKGESSTGNYMDATQFLSADDILTELKSGIEALELPGVMTVLKLDSTLELSYERFDLNNLTATNLTGITSKEHYALPTTVESPNNDSIHSITSISGDGVEANRSWGEYTLTDNEYVYSNSGGSNPGPSNNPNGGATFKVKVKQGGEVESIEIINKGSGYAVGESFTVDNEHLGADQNNQGTDLTFNVGELIGGMTVDVDVENGVCTKMDIKNRGVGITEGMVVKALIPGTGTVDNQGVLQNQGYVTGTATALTPTGFTLKTNDDKGNSNITSFQEEVTSAAEIPYQGIKDRYVKVANTGAAEDSYWLKFTPDEGDSGDGKWEESKAPDTSPGIDASTMPHELFNTEVNVFIFREFSWKERLVGDSVTNPNPSFIGYPIQQGFFHNNRLGFLTEDNVVMSQSGDVDNFFYTSALVSTDADPIDLSCASIRPAKLHAIIPTAQGLILFSNKQQFIMFSDTEIITPSTAVIRGVSNYEMDRVIDPVDVGTSIAFVSKTPSYTRIYGANTRGSQDSPLIYDIGKIVSEWVPNDVTALMASPQNSLIALYGSNSDTMYLYKTYQVDEKNLMQAWFKWKLPGKIQFSVIDQDYMYSVVFNESQGGKQFDLLKASMTQTPDEEIIVTSDGKQVNPHMDFYAPATATKYKEVKTLTLGGTLTGYTAEPTVTIAPPNEGTTATATLTKSGTTITGYTITNPGSGYESEPTVTINAVTNQTYNLSVTAADNNDYTIVGSSRIGAVNGGDPALEVYEGDTLSFALNAAGHPFYIKTAPTTGTGDQVSGVTGQGTEIGGNVVWDTTGVTAGQYFYQCANHSAMFGTINVNSVGGSGATATATIDTNNFSRCYLPYTDHTALTPVIVIAGSGSDNFSGVTESGFTVSPERGNDSEGDYFKVPRKDLSQSNVIVGYKYDYDVHLPKTYYRTDPQKQISDYTANLTIARMKFAVGLSSVVGFKLKRKGYVGESAEFTGDSTDGTDGTNYFVVPFELLDEHGIIVKVNGVKQDSANYTVTKNVDSNNNVIEGQYRVTFVPGKVPMGAIPASAANVWVPTPAEEVLITTDTWYDIQPVQEAGEYLADDVPLTEDNIFTLPIHQRTENFDLRLFSNSPFPIAVNSMMWEGNYSPKLYKRA
tara:strand:+ start:2476 stop:6567 length:4092 start_codon:yes stop_codon:yes gene_type:complete